MPISSHLLQQALKCLVFTTVLWALAVHTAFTPPTAHAARPLVTDDARLVDDRACQLETWTQLSSSGNEYWALPACNFTGNLELTVGTAFLPGEERGGIDDAMLQLQGKTLFQPLQPDSFGWGLVAGTVLHTRSDRRVVDSLYIYLPVSVSFYADRFVLHTNLGGRYEEGDHKGRGTWGLGGELMLTPRISMVGEVFGDSLDLPFSQIGVRLWLVPGYVQLDSTYGLQLGPGHEEEWFSIGLRLLSAPFLR